MAHFHHLQSSNPVGIIHLPVGRTIEIALWGGGPSGEDLDISANDPSIVRVDFFFPRGGIPDRDTRVFQITGLRPGTAMLEARLPRRGPLYASSVQVIVGAAAAASNNLFVYHGTSLDQAKKLMTMDLIPMAVPDYAILDWWEYTDFGKGFYTHPDENKEKADEWATSKNKEWGVVRFCLTTKEFTDIPGAPLHFRDKRHSRPFNAPILFSQPANWIEFVEHNRGIRPAAQRPKDNDWTPYYPWMRGPIWGRVDSGLPGGGPPVPDHIQQINWGGAGLAALNADEAKKRRFLINKHNEHLLEQPR